MEHYIILARSITYAQRMEMQLRRAGIRSQLFRPPRELTELGCAYALRIAVSDLEPALLLLRQAGLPPIQVFQYQFGTYQEVNA